MQSLCPLKLKNEFHRIEEVKHMKDLLEIKEWLLRRGPEWVATKNIYRVIYTVKSQCGYSIG